MKKQRKHYTAEEKVAILRRHLPEQEPVSKLCDELGLQPTVSTAGKKSFLRTGQPLSRPKPAPTIRLSRNASSLCRRRSSARTRFWQS